MPASSPLCPAAPRLGHIVLSPRCPPPHPPSSPQLMLLQKRPIRPSGHSLGAASETRSPRLVSGGSALCAHHHGAPRPPRASPAPGTPPGLPGGIVTWRGGSQAVPDDALLPTLSLGAYFCFYFSSYSALFPFLSRLFLSQLCVLSTTTPRTCGALKP